MFKFKTTKLLTTTIMASAILFASCSKNDDTTPVPEPEKPFDITEHFVAGTLTQATGSKYTSVFFIQFLEDNKALMINTSANNLSGTYTMTEDSLIFEVEGGNARTARFAIDENKKITGAYYTAFTSLQYNATGEILTSSEENALAGKSFKGEEFKMGDVSNNPGFIYSFNNTATQYGSGTIADTINNTRMNYTLIGGSAFKAINGSVTELGFLSNKTLTVFKASGLYYYGKYEQQ